MCSAPITADTTVLNRQEEDRDGADLPYVRM